MTDQEVTVTIAVDQTPAEAVEAIKNVRGWWSEQIEDSTDQVGDEFTYRHKDVHSCRMKLIEFIPQKRVECWLWTIIGSLLFALPSGPQWFRAFGLRSTSRMPPTPNCFFW